MGFTDRKLESLIIVLVVIMLGSMSYLLKGPVHAIIREAEIIYEMPRPKNSIFAALFDLMGREISRKYINPFSNSKKKNVEKKPVVAAPAPAAAVSGAQAKKDNKKTEVTETKKVDVKIVGADESRKLLEETFENNLAYEAGYVPEDGTDSSPTNPNQTREQISSGQWRALLSAQPTKENVAKLIQAYESEQVDEQTFYTIVTDLLRNNHAEVQSLGVVALNSQHSLKSFSVAVHNMDNLSAESQKQLQTYLDSFAVNAHLPVVMAALQLSEADVVTAAMKVILHGYELAKGGAKPLVEPRSARGDVATNAVDSYSKFVPVLKKLAQGSDATIAQQANIILSQMGTSVAAL